MDLFHRFQTIFDWIKTELSVVTGTMNQQMQSKHSCSDGFLHLKAKSIQSPDH